MRDPDRIDEFCKQLAQEWHKVPDWRFGQFIVNVLGTYQGDLFFPEDNKMMEHIKKYFEQDGASPYYRS